jgi:hypothetical protein
VIEAESAGKLAARLRILLLFASVGGCRSTSVFFIVVLGTEHCDHSIPQLRLRIAGPPLGKGVLGDRTEWNGSRSSWRGRLRRNRRPLLGPIRKHLLLSFLEGLRFSSSGAYWEPAEVFGVGFA